MTNDEVDRAIECVALRGEYEMRRAIYRAGYAAGIEAAAKVCDDLCWNGDELKAEDVSNFDCAAAIRALKDKP